MRAPPIAAAVIALLLPAAAHAQEPLHRSTPGVVWLHVESPAPVRLTEHFGFQETQYTNVAVTTFERVRHHCVSPCDEFIHPGGGYRFTFGSLDDSFPDSPGFSLANVGGPLTAHVQPGSRVRLALGRALCVVGGMAVTLGVVGAAFVFSGTSRESTAARVAYVSLIGGGAGAIAGGIALWTKSRTTLRFEPRALGLGLSLHTGAF